MKNTFLLFFIFFFSFTSFSQSKNNYIKLTGGRVLFGTGDISGFGIGIEGAKNIIKQPRPFLNKLLIGGEFLFEDGVQNPKIFNPTVQDILYGKMFRQTSTTTFTPEISYYPFINIIPGFHITAGPSAGYTIQSKEFQATGVPSPNGESIRRSYLEFNNAWIIGYRISLGYEFKIKNILIGPIAYFSNYNNGDINTLAALRAGYVF
jgi:hypothetical protein